MSTLLGFIDKTIDNVGEFPLTVWTPDDVVELLEEIRAQVVKESDDSQPGGA